MLSPSSALFAVALGLPQPAQMAQVAQATQVTQATKTIRVRIQERAPRIDIRGLDLGWSAPTLERHIHSASRWSVQCARGQVIARSDRAGAQPLVVRGALDVSSRAGLVYVGASPYRESIRIIPRPTGCDVVNTVDLESYLDALVNSEFSAAWPTEAIAAQVIAARTYALYQMQERKRGDFDVDSTERDQVYQGASREDVRSRRVVEQTRGLVLTANARPLKAFYHSTCGGRTELPERVWGRSYSGFKRVSKCPYCASSPRYHWELDVAGSELARALKLSGADTIRSVELERSANGRILRVKVSISDSNAASVRTEWVDSNLFRSRLGVDRIRSTAFEVFTYAAPSGETRWRFEGRGSGHGVGLCQWGAKVMGERGFSLKQILTQYYPDAQIRKLW